MECIIFIGIQGSGKSEFYKQNFYNTHIRLNLDMFKTRYREKIFLNACIEAKQSFVVDNTNPKKTDREKYICLSKKNSFKIIGYYFKSSISECIERNNLREGKEKLPIVALRSVSKELVFPDYYEGFDELYYVKIENNKFVVEDYKDEI